MSIFFSSRSPVRASPVVALLRLGAGPVGGLALARVGEEIKCTTKNKDSTKHLPLVPHMFLDSVVVIIINSNNNYDNKNTTTSYVELPPRFGKAWFAD